MTPQFPEISPLMLLAALASPTPPAVLDIRLAKDIALDPTHIPTAQTMTHEDAERQVAVSAPHGAVVICHKGLKLSAGVTARLLGRNIDVHRLQGGHVGWTDLGLPTTDQPPVARIALPLEANAEEVLRVWSTLRFQAPMAELLEVPLEDMNGVVARFDACAPDALPALTLPRLSRLYAAPDLLSEALRASPRPSATFAMLDLAYRGALRHGDVLEIWQTTDPETGQ